VRLAEIQRAAWERLLATLRAGFGLPPCRLVEAPPTGSRGPAGERRPRTGPRNDTAEPPSFEVLRRSLGFVPNLYRAQRLNPEVLEAEVFAVEKVLLAPGLLSRERKEAILLGVAGAHRNLYGMTLHTELLGTLGVSEATCDGIVADLHGAGLPAPDVALLDVTRTLALGPPFAAPPAAESLADAGLTREEAAEAVVMAAFANFLDTLSRELGVAPDFPPRIALPANLPGGEDRLTPDEGSRPDHPQVPDADAGLVARVRAGDVEAFGELVRRHERRVYRTLVGITGNAAEAEDCAQRAFLKAYQGLASFAGASTFATWLTRIAINEGLERARRRKPFEPLAEEHENDRGFRPQRLQAWTETPEELFAKAELKAIVEREMLKLPPRYRAAVLLRDIEGLSTPEAAAALGLGIPTLKTHLLRGRLLLREALTPYFAQRARMARA
jgi:RNA polymerase sigma-70 factor (ECF subfamily)